MSLGPESGVWDREEVDMKRESTGFDQDTELCGRYLTVKHLLRGKIKRSGLKV